MSHANNTRRTSTTSRRHKFRRIRNKLRNLTKATQQVTRTKIDTSFSHRDTHKIPMPTQITMVAQARIITRLSCNRRSTRLRQSRQAITQRRQRHVQQTLRITTVNILLILDRARLTRNRMTEGRLTSTLFRSTLISTRHIKRIIARQARHIIQRITIRNPVTERHNRLSITRLTSTSSLDRFQTPLIAQPTSTVATDSIRLRTIRISQIIPRTRITRTSPCTLTNTHRSKVSHQRRLQIRNPRIRILRSYEI